MSISTNGGSNPTSITYNSKNVTELWYKSSPSATAVQVWPSKDGAAYYLPDIHFVQVGYNSTEVNPWITYTSPQGITQTRKFTDGGTGIGRIEGMEPGGSISFGVSGRQTYYYIDDVKVSSTRYTIQSTDNVNKFYFQSGYYDPKTNSYTWMKFYRNYDMEDVYINQNDNGYWITVSNIAETSDKRLAVSGPCSYRCPNSQYSSCSGYDLPIDGANQKVWLASTNVTNRLGNISATGDAAFKSDKNIYLDGELLTSSGRSYSKEIRHFPAKCNAAKDNDEYWSYQLSDYTKQYIYKKIIRINYTRDGVFLYTK